MNPIFYIDFYKVGHVQQYPADTEQVWSNWTPRSSRIPEVTHVKHFGLQYFIKKYLLDEFSGQFFAMPIEMVLREYRRVISATLGIASPKTDHIEALHELEFLPIKIYSIPEGLETPLNCPSMVLTNTLPEFFWLPNYLETLLSNILWKPSTSATTAARYRKIFQAAAEAAGESDFSFIDWQGHDFSFRGMSGLEDAVLSGMGHLTCFSGTDTIPAILAAKQYYGAELTTGGSVPATEHSVMSAGFQDREFETFRRIIEEIYPKGIVSVVSDTWDLWRVLTDYIPRLKKTILAREGKVVIRPDSGDPVKIICGDYDAPGGSPQALGTLRLLERALGSTKGMIRNAGAIYGDSITPERAAKILHRCVHELRLSPYNMVFGIGSYTYEYVTRDTFNFAMKATAVKRSGTVYPIFKKPVTDDGRKNSRFGIPLVYRDEQSTEEHPAFFCSERYGLPGQLDECAFEKVFENGVLLKEVDFETVRKRVRS
jgi:nicotinamide phosphoribosyltransferase